MGKVEFYECDRCGAQTDGRAAHIQTFKKVGMFPNHVKDFDLCDGCAEELEKFFAKALEKVGYVREVKRRAEG
jgi:hypothetical protein